MSSFVIFGNLERPFERMAAAIKETYELFPKPLIIQAGANYGLFTDTPADIEVFHHCSFSDFSQFIQSASVIVTHGGVGAVKEAVLSGMRPAVFVRQGSRGEHIDNHQVDWCDLLFATQIAAKMWDARDLRKFLTNEVHRQQDMIAAHEFFDETKLKSAIHAFVHNAVQARRVRQ
jgi:UDP-N-acetylglucosamine transferase subunit ALG13